MDTVYFVCAAVGGTVLIVQTLLLALGLGGDDAGHGADLHHDVDAADSFFQVLSLKTLVSFMTFFGLAGLAGQDRGWTPASTLLAAVGAGVVAVIVVAWLMNGLARLQSKGNVDLGNAVGVHGRVYLRVPGENAGHGKVTVEVQGRKLECKAFTRGPELPTGAEVEVVAASGQDSVEVRALSS